MSRDVITAGSTMRIPLLYRGEYSQWHKRNETAKDLWDALERQMCGSEYGEQDRKAAILYEYETFKANEGEQDESKRDHSWFDNGDSVIVSGRVFTNGDQSLTVIPQVSLAGNAQNAPPTLKDQKFWTVEEKMTQKIDRLARSLIYVKS
nr:hypothetical protein [Tanacetum cinerariifolium]